MNVRVHVQGIVCLISGLALLGSLIGVQTCEATTYYVAPDGSDWNPGTEDQPFQTLGRGVRDLSPGDTLYVKNGTYTGGYELSNIPSGASWDNPVTMAAYPGHSPVIGAPGQAVVLPLVKSRYVVIDGFFIDGTNTGVGIEITWGAGIADHIRIQNSDIAYAQFGIFVTEGSDGNEFIRLQVHDNGFTDFNHGIYIRSSNNLVEDCSIYDNMGWGVHLYSGWQRGVDNNVIRNNAIYDNGRAGTRGDGILLSSGSGNQAYNNVVWGNVGGIRIDYNASNTYVYDNTVYENTGYGIYIGTQSYNALVESNSISNN
jgi:parallel beta-helix repeat protein